MERHDENSLIIYTDGSMLSKPRRGGYAFRLIHVDADGEETHLLDDNPPGFVGATSSHMELVACVEALKLVTGRRAPIPTSAFAKIVIYTDSLYVQEHIYD